MHAQGANPGRAARCVVAGILDVLHIEGVEEPAPGMHGVVAFDNRLAAVAEIAVAQQEAQPAELEIPLVVLLDGVGDESESHLIF